MSAPVNPRAAIYARISQDRGGAGLGVERQEQLCRDLAERKSWEVVEILVDNDLSAYHGAPRPAYDRLLEGMETGAYDAVLVVDQDRLTRHTRELEDFITLADKAGTALATVSGDLDLSTSDGRFRARIMGAVARQESEKKSERLRRQREQAAKRGVSHGGRRAYGYRRGGHDVEPREAGNVLEAARRFLAGESLPRIADDWNLRGIRSSSGKEWTTTSLRTMLAGPRIAGLRVHRGEVVGDAAWTAIIDRDTHERIRAILGDPRRTQRGRPAEHLLTGMLRCALCEGRMSSSTRRGGAKRYVCHKGPGRTGCGRMAVTAAGIEHEVAERVIAALAGTGLAGVERRSEGGAHIAERLRADEQKLEQLALDFAEDRIGRSEWLTVREAVQRRIDTARRAMRQDASVAVLATLPTDAESLRREWDTADVPRRRQILAAVVDHVVVKPADGPGPFDPERVNVVWRA